MPDDPPFPPPPPNAASSNEIFLRNLPFDVKTEDLEELCGSIGPVKRASIIQNEGVSRGFGFVKFAIPEDATRAASTLHNSAFKGRHLSIELALKKGQRPQGIAPAKKKIEIKAKGEELSIIDAKNVPSTAINGSITRSTTRKTRDLKNPKVIQQEKPRSLLAFNLADQTTEKQLYKRVKKIETPKQINIEELDGARVAVLSFESSAAAVKVKKKLDNHIIHGKKLFLRPLQGEKEVQQPDSGDGEEELAERNKKGDKSSLPSGRATRRAGLNIDMLKGQAKRAGRVIIRNLSFKATEADLKEALSVYGPVLEAAVPKVKVNGGVEGQRGFGFITFACAEDAEKAIKSDHRLTIKGREVAVDTCLGRREYQEQKSAQDKIEAVVEKEEDPIGNGIASMGDLKHDEENKKSDSPDGSDDGVIVAVHDDDVKEEEQEEEEEEEEEETEEEDEEDQDDDDVEESDAKPENENDTKQSKVQSKSDVEEGKTVFVRNVPFDAIPESLKAAFGAYGPVAFGALVKDKASGMSKGTAFVKFKSVKGVETVLAAVAAAGGSLDLMGRQLKIDRAVERDQAPQLSTNGKDGESKKKGGPKTDRRNLYLANEGLVLSSEDQEPKTDLDKRQREQAEKKTKLRNPLFFVSATRLSIRNLGRSVTDGQLRSLLEEAVKKGLKGGKVTIEDLKLQRQAQGDSTVLLPDTGELKVPSKTRDLVVKVKIMRDLDKRPVDGIYPSRGYGFADFSNHAHALAALRHINNNPSYSSMAHGGSGGGAAELGEGRKGARLILCFAVENHNALLKKRQREDKSAQQISSPAIEEPKGEKKSRGRRQREQRRSIDNQGESLQVEKRNGTGSRAPPPVKSVERVTGKQRHISRKRPITEKDGERANDGSEEGQILLSNSLESEDYGRDKKKRRKGGNKTSVSQEENRRFLSQVDLRKKALMCKLEGSKKEVRSTERWFEGL